MTGSTAMDHERNSSKHAEKLAEYESWNWKPEYRPYEDLRVAENKGWERQSHVDRLKDFIPFWRDGVYAAARGGDAGRLEEFLEKLDEEWRKNRPWEQVGSDGWGVNNGEDIWGTGVADWAAPEQPQGADGWGPGKGDWGVPSDRTAEWGEETPDWGASKRGNGATGWGQGTGDSRGLSENVGASDGGWHRRPDRRKRREKDRNEEMPDRDVWTFVEKVARREDASAERRRRMHQFYEMPTQKKVQKINEMIRSLQVQS
ncbi:hypothetical protein AcV5_004628 [Taiwanofungus camphoratus]|nr:hypothetical protein AcV5_004628 [Antrodia cinnamomea]